MKIGLFGRTSLITRSTMQLGFIVLSLLGPAAGVSFGQSSPDLKAVLEGVSQAYGTLSRYEVVETTTTELGGGNEKGLLKSTIRIAAEGPNKFRLEGEESAEINGLWTDSGHGPIITVNDGTNAWEISPTANSYAKVKPSDLPTIRMWARSAEKGVFDTPLMLRREAANVTLVGEESLTLDANRIDCFVLTLTLPDHPESTMLWIEKGRFLIRRIRSEQPASQETLGRSISITSDFPVVNIGGPLPESMFVFSPPPFAVEVDKVRP